MNTSELYWVARDHSFDSETLFFRVQTPFPLPVCAGWRVTNDKWILHSNSKRAASSFTFADKRAPPLVLLSNGNGIYIWNLMELMVSIRWVKRLFRFAVLKVKPCETQLVWHWAVLCGGGGAPWRHARRDVQGRRQRSRDAWQAGATRCHTVPHGATRFHISTGHHTAHVSRYYLCGHLSTVQGMLVQLEHFWEDIFGHFLIYSHHAVQRLSVPCSARIWCSLGFKIS